MLAVVTLTRWRITAFSNRPLTIRPCITTSREVCVLALRLVVSAAMSAQPAHRIRLAQPMDNHLRDQVPLLGTIQAPPQ